MNPNTVWELEQRRLITETLQDYCEHVDRNDPASLVSEVFTDDAVFELGSSRAVVGSDNLARMFAKTLAPFTRTSHHLTNVKVRFEGDTEATSSAYIYAWHQLADGRQVEVWGRYNDRLRLTPQGWRIASRRLSAVGQSGWDEVPFELAERLPSPAELPSPQVTRR